jgi:hypothetical protein
MGVWFSKSSRSEFNNQKGPEAKPGLSIYGHAGESTRLLTVMDEAAW